MRAHLVLGLCLAFSLSACGRSDERTFTLQGQVLSLEPARKLLTVKHEEIKGFMPAMTMPYEVRDTRLLDGLAPGDLINATLVVVSNGAYLSAIKKWDRRRSRSRHPSRPTLRPLRDSSC